MPDSNPKAQRIKPMPLHPKSQSELDQISRELVALLARGGPAVTKRTAPAVLQVERHVLGLIGALKQLEPGMESKVKAFIASKFQQSRVAEKPRESPPKKNK